MQIIARVMAAFLLGLVVVIAVGQRFNPAGLTTDEARLAEALAVSLAGFALMLIPPYRQQRRIMAGAVLSIIGISAFYVINFQQSGQWPGGWVMPLFFVPGSLELLGRCR